MLTNAFARVPRVLAILAIAIAGAWIATATPAAASSANLTGHWTFDEGSGTSAADSSAGGHPLTLQGGASWGPGVVGPCALSAGRQRSVRGERRTGHRHDPELHGVGLGQPLQLGGYQTFVSQDGSQVSGFYLQLRGDTGRFAFTQLAYDSGARSGRSRPRARSSRSPASGTSSTGVYNAPKHTISLYVNGALAADAVVRRPAGRRAARWRSAAGRFGGNPVDFVSGRIDDVQVYAGVLGASRSSGWPGRAR